MVTHGDFPAGRIAYGTELMRTGVSLNFYLNQPDNSSPDSVWRTFLERWWGHRESTEHISGAPQECYRIFRGELEKLADRFSGEKAVSPAVTEDQIVQLLAVAAILLRQHQVNKRGQCRFCGWVSWKWRPWSRRPPCTVYRTVSFVMGQGLDEVWWRLFESLGKEWSLMEVRAWLKERALDRATCVVCGEAGSNDGSEDRQSC